MCALRADCFSRLFYERISPNFQRAAPPDPRRTRSVARGSLRPEQEALARRAHQPPAADCVRRAWLA